MDVDVNKLNKTRRDEWSTCIERTRASKIFEKELTTVVKDVSQSDVGQGEIGDCYFMAVIGAFAAMHPQMIADLFITNYFNEKGRYRIRVYINGHPEEIEVDDYIAYNKKYKCPKFADKVTSNIWPILLEKAWAKVVGSYEGIISGSGTEAFNFLLPYETEVKKYELTEEHRSLFKEEITSSIKAKHLVICAASSKDNGSCLELGKELGLESDHYYAITGIYSIEQKTVQNPYSCFRKEIVSKVNLLKIFNPQNTQKYTGPWHDGDRRWNEEIKENVDFDKKSKGEIFIDLDTFFILFRQFTF